MDEIIDKMEQLKIKNTLLLNKDYVYIIYSNNDIKDVFTDEDDAKKFSNYEDTIIKLSRWDLNLW